MKSLTLSFFIILASSLSSFAQEDAIMRYFSKYVAKKLSELPLRLFPANNMDL